MVPRNSYIPISPACLAKQALMVHFPSVVRVSKSMAHATAPLLGTKLLTNIYAMEITSDKCLSEVRSLINSPSKIQAVRSLQGNEAQKFIDFLDQVSKSPLLAFLRLSHWPRFLPCHASGGDFGGGDYYFSLRFAKPAGLYPPLILFSGI